MCCCNKFSGFFKRICGAMSLDETRQSQRPYRYGMVLLCIGALINWLGLAENYVEPVRYIGVACIIAGALLICAAMCCWLQAPAPRQPPQTHQIDDPIHVISVPSDDEIMQQKPPDYDSVAGAPPTYDDAIKLNPGYHLPRVHIPNNGRNSIQRSTSVDASMRGSDRSNNHSHILSAAALNVLLTPIASGSRETIPGQLETVVVQSHHIPAQIPKTPPPPYRPLRTIR